MISKRIYTGFDLVKLIAAICIIAIHTRAPFFNIIGRLGVPFFAIVSSILFFNHYQRLIKCEEKKDYLLKFCRRIFLLYITWQVIYIPIAIRQFRVIMASLKGTGFKNLLVYFLDFFFPAVYNSQGVDLTQDANGWGPSWYLLASIIAMPVLVGLLRLFKQHVLPVFIICILVEIYIILADEFSDWTHLSPIMNHTFLRLLIYFCLGYLIVYYHDFLYSWSKYSVQLLAVCFCLFLVESLVVGHFAGDYNTEEIITTVPTGLFLALVTMNYYPKLHYPVQVRNMSTFLYCFQIWPIVIMRKVFETRGWGSQHLILFIVVLLISFICFFLYEKCRQHFKWRFLKYMV
ncbi:acyltransferase family protein [Limosilactobacillus vaginalis]|nr:acyltransferase family protein [Limosilactobacillus vaginalis]MCI6853544.1 acyltransferase family protein [Limosilactobacillus vaginalis]HIT44347.1 acyltransferase family protein [Candidatus Avacholeplasma faecigallinarum]